MEHYVGCPTNRKYNVCTCDMSGEECCVIAWEIQRMEGKLRWWHFTERLTLWAFPPPPISKGDI